MSTLSWNPRSTGDYVSRLPTRAPIAFLHRLPGYEATPLVALPEVASELGIAALEIKVESTRLTLPSCHVLGVAWALWRGLGERLGREPTGWTTFEELRAVLPGERLPAVCAGGDPSFLRAVARVARWFGLKARLHVPEGVAAARLAGASADGAEMETVAGLVHAASAAARAAAGPGELFLSEVGPADDPSVLRLVEGYGALFFEADEELAAASSAPGTLVVLPAGSGLLSAAAVRHYRRPGLRTPPRVVAVEPDTAPILAAMIRSGVFDPSREGPGAVLNSGFGGHPIAPAAWPLLREGLDLATTVDDKILADAMRLLAREHIVAGELGAAPLAALLALAKAPEAERRRAGFGATTRALVIVAEGATDRDSWRRAVGADRSRA